MPNENDIDDIDEDFPGEKIGEWIQVDADTHVMVVELIAENMPEDDFITHARCVMQVETESHAVALCPTIIPIALVMQWIEDENDTIID